MSTPATWGQVGERPVTAVAEQEFDRARFDESLELARTQLTLPLELDEDREIG